MTELAMNIPTFSSSLALDPVLYADLSYQLSNVLPFSTVTNLVLAFRKVAVGE